MFQQPRSSSQGPPPESMATTSRAPNQDYTPESPPYGNESLRKEAKFRGSSGRPTGSANREEEAANQALPHKTPVIEAAGRAKNRHRGGKRRAKLSVVILETTAATVKAMDNAGKDFAANIAKLTKALRKAQAAGGQDDISQAKAALQVAGPPAPIIWAKLLGTLLAEEGPSSSTKAVLRDEVSKFDTQPPEVRICKLERGNNDGLKMIVFAHHNVELVQAVQRALTAVGGCVCRPPGRPDPSEEQLSDLIRSPC